ncbi:LacI family transcriptional regulator [Microbacteriaceae bacterium SG_E_30_P1]|uniref:LacI family transcriptional regulator n=1 Tax=Antiquaquibacter oligotrophicus TaxID=2880260 RepID=A0ABT6KS09_9MICO|nr:LacI family DNA-binding transcriptional regulator [Antiquaquibacter oligotrophicus]MDH6181997.1 LacI family transcriptional regulator [Antiquaquibacter oligotrophicus]UDF12334.1 LacI family transcriptional regulator [Antiquaquibacter oligotrophicus]
MIKIVDVAREAGVAPSTVSRALNNHPTVGEEYVRRVKVAAEKLGYRPNGVARSLRRQSTDFIALIIPDIGNHFHTAVARGVEDVAREAGLSVLLCNSDEDAAKEATYIGVALSEKVAGVLLCPHNSDSDISLLTENSIPVVAIDRTLGENIDAVTTDSVHGAREATAHLIREGWTRPGCSAGPTDIETAKWRAQGYVEAVLAAGGEPIVEHGTFDQQGGADTAAALLDREDPPDSLFVSSEQMALGVLAELKRRGLEPGRDIGILTFDDTPWAQLIYPPMTVVEQPAYDVGAKAARMLVERIRGGSRLEARQVSLPTRLIVRGSSLR